MKSGKWFIALTGGVGLMMSAFATTTVVADGVSANVEAPTAVQLSTVALIPAETKVSQNAEVRQATMAPVIADLSSGPSLDSIWDKHQCFIVLSGHCL